MDGIQGFFRKYGAVPADGRGPNYPAASTDALLVHLRGLADARRGCRAAGLAANHREVAPVLADLSAVAGELWGRVTGLAAECGRQSADWPGRNEVGRILAGLSMAGDVLRVEAK